MVMRKRSREVERQVETEFDRLKQNYPLVRDVITGPALLATWFLFGDEMWVKPELLQHDHGPKSATSGSE